MRTPFILLETKEIIASVLNLSIEHLDKGEDMTDKEGLGDELQCSYRQCDRMNMYHK